MCRWNTVKEVLLTDMLDKSEVQHQGLYDDVVKATVIFDVCSGRSLVSALSARRVMEDLSLTAVCGACAFHLWWRWPCQRSLRRMFACRAAWLRVAGTLLSFLCSRQRVFQLAASCGDFLLSWQLCCHRASTERGTKGLRSQQCASQHGQVGVRAGGTGDRGTKAAVGKTGPPHRTGTRTERYAHTSAPSHVV